MVTVTEPYIPGFLAFREVGFLLNCLEELKEEKPDLVPQVLELFQIKNACSKPMIVFIMSRLID